MVRENRTSKQLAWYRPHITTLIAVILVTAAVTSSQRELRGGIGAGNSWRMTSTYYQGWPVYCRQLTICETGDFSPRAQQFAVATSRTESHWFTIGLLSDIAASIMVILSTAIVCEMWLRRRLRPWQLDVRSLFLIVTVIATLTFLYQNEFAIYVWWSGFINDGSLILHGGLHFSPWYTVYGMYVGLGCCVVVLCVAFTVFGTILFNAASRRCPNLTPTIATDHADARETSAMSVSDGKLTPRSS